MTLAIPDFSVARVLVAGDVMLDRYLFGGTSRISPEAPVPVVHVHTSDDRPGGAANVAVNLATLGARTTLLGVVGCDPEAELLRGLLARGGIDCRFVESKGRPTITKTRVQSRGQQLIRLDREEPAGGGTDEGLADFFIGELDGSDVVVLSDYGKGALAEVQRMIAACRERGLRVLIDPKGTDFDRYRGATLMTPNQAEFEAVAGACRTEAELVERARDMVARLELDALVVTRSEKGMLLVATDSEPVFLSADAASGAALETAAALANLAAGLVVRKIGVASASPWELQVALHQRGEGGRGLFNEAELLAAEAEARSRGERIVMTNGCFDVLHAGHVSYLEEAKSLGDRLIVAVNDDASVTRLKGPQRPINKLADRMAVLSGLAAVDWVVPFSEDTPARLIEAVRPDVLVKGGDYRVEDIAGGEAVLQSGGEVRVLAFREGHSSTRIIDKLAQ